MFHSVDEYLAKEELFGGTVDLANKIREDPLFEIK